jgi:hypothetical protein
MFCTRDCWDLLLGKRLAAHFEHESDFLMYFAGGFCEYKKLTDGDWNRLFNLAPINSYSNLGYILVGNWLMSNALGEGQIDETNGRNLFSKHPTLPFLFGMQFVIIGIGSYIYHASVSYFGYFMDHANILATTLFLTFYSFLNLYSDELDQELIPQYGIAIYIVSVIIAWTNQYYHFLHTWVTLPPLLSLAGYAITSHESETHDEYLITAGVFGVIAGLMGEPFDDWPFCFPESIF